MASAFTDVSTPKGLGQLMKHLANSSYIEGHAPSAADFEVFDKFAGKVPDLKFSHVNRWYRHIASYEPERHTFVIQQAKEEVKEAKEEDDDFDLFDNDPDAEAEHEAIIEQRAKEQLAKNALKVKPIAKSNIVYDVKPWEADTDLTLIEEKVRAISMPGLLWGASEFKPIAYGVRKLTIMCVIEDDLVSSDVLRKQIKQNKDLVQSVDIASFTKI